MAVDFAKNYLQWFEDSEESPCTILDLSYTNLILRLHHVPRHQIGQFPALLALSLLVRGLESIHCLFDPRPQICAMEGLLIDYLPTVLTVPPEPILTFCWPRLFQHNTNSVGESHGVVRDVRGEQEHLPFADRDVSEIAFVDDFEEHRSFVLVEPFGGLVDVVV